MIKKINITIPYRHGTEISVFQHYIITSLCNEAIRGRVDAEEAKKLKKISSRLCIGRDEAQQIATAFSDDAESYCEMFSSWLSSGMEALNVLRERMPSLLQEVNIVCFSIHVCAKQDYQNVYNAACSIFPEADIKKRGSSTIVVNMSNEDIFEDVLTEDPNVRARNLLAQALSDEEKEELDTTGYLSVPSTLYKNRIYLIPLIKHNKIKVKINDTVEWKLCVDFPDVNLPEADRVLAHKLMIEANESGWLAEAKQLKL